MKQLCLIAMALAISMAMFSLASATNFLILTKGIGGGGTCNSLDFSQSCNSQYLAFGGIP